LCNPKIEELDRYILLKSYGFVKEAKIYKNVKKCKPNVNPNDLKCKPNVNPNDLKCKPNVNPNNTSNICQYCNKEFASRQGKYKHIKRFCKEKNIKELTELKEENNKLRKLYDNKEPTKIINNTDNSTTNNNIIINNFGSESDDYMTKSLLLRSLKDSTKFYDIIIYEKFFNPKYPENRTIENNNLNSKYMYIIKNRKKTVILKSDCYDDLIYDIITDCDNKRYELEEKGCPIGKLEKEKLDRIDERSSTKLTYDRVNAALANGSNK